MLDKLIAKVRTMRIGLEKEAKNQGEKADKNMAMM
jgi:hypothetical protein